MTPPEPGAPRPLSARIVEGGVVHPTVRDDDRLLMGVFDAADNYVEGTVLDRRGGTVASPVPPDRARTVEDADVPEAIYAGPLYYHFGHFLLESLARAWYAAQHPDLPIVWAGAHTWDPGRGLKRWQREILDVLRLDNPVRLVTSPQRVGALHVPDIGYRYDDWFHPEHAAFLARHAGPPQEPGARLWLSRSRLRSDARDLNAAPIERRLSQAGWTVVHPERLSVPEQLAHFARAETVAGEEGSAFHLVALLEDLSSKRLQVFRRHGEEHPNMTTIGEARGIDQTFYSLRGEVVARASGRTVTKLSPSASEVLDVLGVPVPPSRPPTEPPATTTALLRVLDGVPHDRLLVIGDPDAALVLGSGATVRVAVSPRFDFDPREHAGMGVDFYETGLAQYVEHFHRKRGRFGVVRVVGPDADALVDAVRESLALARPHTTWLLGPGEAAARAAARLPTVLPGLEVRTVRDGGRVLHVVTQGVPTPAPRPGRGRRPGGRGGMEYLRSLRARVRRAPA